jgi:hypothetical protein
MPAFFKTSPSKVCVGNFELSPGKQLISRDMLVRIWICLTLDIPQCRTPEHTIKQQSISQKGKATKLSGIQPSVSRTGLTSGWTLFISPFPPLFPYICQTRGPVFLTPGLVLVTCPPTRGQSVRQWAPASCCGVIEQFGAGTPCKPQHILSFLESLQDAGAFVLSKVPLFP